jgi:CHAD domain-containing protein
MADAITQIARALTDALARQQHLLTASWSDAVAGDVRGVHRSRVASRRLREALAIAAAAGSGGRAARARRLARRITRALGPVRELDVALAELDVVAARHRWPESAGAAIRRDLERARGNQRRRLHHETAGLARGTIRARIERAAADIADLSTPSDVSRAMARHVLRRADRVETQVALCGTLYAADRLHALRIAVKKLRYTIEIAGPLLGRAAGPALRQLRAMQQRLGRLHDVQVLMEALQSGAARDTPRASWDWPAMLDDLERDCREQHARIVRLLPALARTVSAVRRNATLQALTGRRAIMRVESLTRSRRSGARSRRTSDRSA